jgi:hypothetical protein
MSSEKLLNDAGMKCDLCDKPAEGKLCEGCLTEICTEAMESLVADGKFIRCGVDPVTGQQCYKLVRPN